MSEFKTYPRKGSVTARPYVIGEDMTYISLSAVDSERASLDGGMIAQNPDNPDDQWYISPEYFSKNFGDPIG